MFLFPRHCFLNSWFYKDQFVNTETVDRGCSVKKGVLKNFAKFTGKQLCQVSPFIKSLWHRCFPVNFAKFQRTPSLQNTSGRLLLYREYTCTISFPKFSTKDSMLFNQKNILWHFMVIAGMFFLSHWFVSYGSAVFCKGN